MDGADVTSWSDQSGKGNDANELTNPPRFETTETDRINFNPSVRFDGVNDQLVTSLGVLAGSSNYSFLAVGIREDRFANILLESDLVSLEFSLGYFGNSTFVFQTGGGGTATTPFVHDQPAQTPFILSGGIGVGSEERNGQTTSYVANTGVFPNVSSSYVGRGLFGFYNGRISEIIVYNASLGAMEESRVKSYLAIKYGLSLGQNESVQDYVDSDGTVIWDASVVGSEYNEGIAAIGQDDLSNLDQPQSKSTNADAIVEIGENGGGIENGEFLFWSHNGERVAFSNVETPGGIAERLIRQWMIKETGEIGSVDVSFDLTSLTFRDSPASSDFYLLTDADGVFDSGAASLVASSYSEKIVTFTGVGEDVFEDGMYFTLGCQNCERASPGGVEDELVLWLKANVGTSTTIDGTGLTSWDDQSGSGNNAAGGGAAPDYQDNETDNINFNPTVAFDGRDHFLDISLGDLEGGSNYSFFAIGVRSSTAMNVPLGSNLAKEEFFFGYDGSQDFGFRANAASGTLVLTQSPSEVDRPEVSPFMLSGINSIGEEERNGLRARSMVNSNGMFPAASEYYVGRIEESYYTGSLSEIIVYKKNLDSSNESQVKSYLAIKYGLSLGQNEGAQNYVDSSGNVIWNAGGSGAYGKDITAIGRDDRSGLNQAQSRSTNHESIVTISESGGGMEDGEFLFWSNDGGGRAFSEDDLPSGISQRLTREWIIEETGEVGSTDLSFDLSGITLPLGANVATNFYLLTDGDGTFASGSSRVVASSINNNVVEFLTVSEDMLDDGRYFTLGVDLNRAPSAAADTVVRVPGTGLVKIFVPDLLANDSDADGDSLSFLPAQLPSTSANGSPLSVFNDGRWILYEPSQREPVVDDTFTYEIEDVGNATAEATVTIKVEVSAMESSNFTGPTISGSDVDVGFRGIPGRKYRVQSTVNLEDPITWTDESGIITAGPRGRVSYKDLNAASDSGAKFYRTIEVDE